MNALVLANGNLDEIEILQERIRNEEFDLVIGVDGGSRYAPELNVSVDVIIGDMDSISPDGHQRNNDARFISYPEEKDETDLELALLYAREQGVDKIVVVGAMGGRMDMTISNIQLVAYASSDSCGIEVWHGNQTGWVILPPGEDIPGNSGDTVSLIPLGGNARGIITTGMKYPLNNENLTMQTRGVSNQIDISPAHVAFSDGLLLVVHTPGNTFER
ncbi:MAG: thiamine diphosphokinase [Dehalococcoidales bacterium]|nr:MAG: thiamine diphosphokinase [Dehalococcoidales bacterium]